ncbi:MAG: helix-turn-helix domain-containing protein [Patescibacteria group bacterium]
MRYTQQNKSAVIGFSRNLRIRHYCHIRKDERLEIAILRKNGYSIRRSIAKAMKISLASVSRELKRNSNMVGVYDALKAQHKARIKRLISIQC